MRGGNTSRRVSRGPGADKGRFEGPTVKDTPMTEFDENGFGLGADNQAAVASLTIYRAFRYGRNAELILTDNRSHEIADADVSGVSPDGFPMFADEGTARVIDDGRAAHGGKPPATLHSRGRTFRTRASISRCRPTSGRSSARGYSRGLVRAARRTLVSADVIALTGEQPFELAPGVEHARLHRTKRAINDSRDLGIVEAVKVVELDDGALLGR
jgi:hypothetical protein